jgi:hypothetical protein
MRGFEHNRYGGLCTVMEKVIDIWRELGGFLNVVS